MKLAEVEYLNLDRTKLWGKEDLRDAKIIALTTLVQGYTNKAHAATQNLSNHDASNNKKNICPNTRRREGEWIEHPKNREIDKVINGKKVKWCKKCNNGKCSWVVTHYTEGHVDNFVPIKRNGGERDAYEVINNTKVAKKLRLSQEIKSAMNTLTGFDEVNEVDDEDLDFYTDRCQSEPSCTATLFYCIQ